MGIFDFKQKKDVAGAQGSFAMESLPTPPPLHEFPSPESMQKMPIDNQVFTPPPLPNIEPIGQKPIAFAQDTKPINNWQQQGSAPKEPIQAPPMDFAKPISLPPTMQNIPRREAPSQMQNMTNASQPQNPFSIPKPTDLPLKESLPSFSGEQERTPAPKSLPKELPHFSFEQKKDMPVPFPSGQGLRIKQQSEHDMDVPAPPPNLRSEISPLELERLEEKYLDRRPRISDVEHDYKYARHQKLTRPLFVRTDDYKQILNFFIDIKDTLSESEETVYRLENLKKNSDVEYAEFKKAVEEIQRKLIYVDKTIFEN